MLRQKLLWPQSEEAGSPSSAYIREVLVKMGLPEKLSDHTSMISFSDGSMCVKIEFTVEPEEAICSYKLKRKFGDWP